MPDGFCFPGRTTVSSGQPRSDLRDEEHPPVTARLVKYLLTARQLGQLAEGPRARERFLTEAVPLRHTLRGDSLARLNKGTCTLCLLWFFCFGFFL